MSAYSSSAWVSVTNSWFRSTEVEYTHSKLTVENTCYEGASSCVSVYQQQMS